VSSSGHINAAGHHFDPTFDLMTKTTTTPLTLLREGKLPQMVRWYDPSLLMRVGIRTAISSVFGQYADQRLVQAATDSGDVKDIRTRYDYSKPDPANPDKSVELDETGALWVDYLADTGDGFLSTYTLAYLLAADSLRVNNADNSGRMSLRHGHILIMGGDQCYPQATREDYKSKLLTPFNWAFDVRQPTRKVFAIPGNHDWYDGLNAFDSVFCSSRDRLNEEKGEQIGGWRCHQHRSYWALKLPYNWWVWGTDIQFSKFLDSSQVAYFRSVAAELKPGDKLVLCIAEPSWLLSDFGKDDDGSNFFEITRIAREAGADIVAVVAGDWHVYARYYAPEIDVHFITAGGGGSFTHPTHVLKNEISVSWPEQTGGDAPATAGGSMGPPAPGWTKKDVDIRLKPKDPKAAEKPVAARVGEVVADAREVAREVAADVAKELNAEKLEKALGGAHKTRQKDAKCYPSRSMSVLLSLGNIFFPFRNMWFAAFIGGIYWLITWQFYALVTEHDISSGAIDAIGMLDRTGKLVSFWDVFKYLPFYLIQGFLVSLPLAGMFAALFAVLVWYVDGGNRRPLFRWFRKLSVGGLHFAAHVAAMFALGLALVQWHNWVAPKLHTYAEHIWVTTAKDTNSMTGAVARKVLEPISTERQAAVQRHKGEQAQTNTTVTRRAPMPTNAQPSTTNRINPQSFRQIVGFVLYPLEMILIGGLLGGFIWGLYWVLTGLFLRMHAEDAFAALRLNSYKNFLRFKFEKDQLTIYPIGIDEVPKARFWTARKGAVRVPPHNPQLIAPKDIPVRLIERPIVIRANRG
jgi:hypothetical protein